MITFFLVILTLLILGVTFGSIGALIYVVWLHLSDEWNEWSE